MALLRIGERKRPELMHARRMAATASASGADSYLERLLKLIPAEAIGIYLVGLQVVAGDQASDAAVARWSLACLIFVFVFRVIVSSESPTFGLMAGKGIKQWWQDLRGEVQWPAVFIAMASFAVWVAALGHPLAPLPVDWFDWCSADAQARDNVLCASDRFGTAALLLWTPIAAFLYSGERLGKPKRNPPEQDQTPDEASAPSPTETMPPPTAAPLASPRDVIGPDTRRRPPALASPPYMSICLLHVFEPNRSRASRVGTGWLFANDKVVTAAHVVSGASRVTGWFAYDDQTDRALDYFEESAWEVHPEYLRSGSRRHDIAVIRLSDPVSGLVPLRTGRLGNAVGELHVAGYPLDKGGLTMLEAAGEAQGMGDGALLHDVDTDDGQSGAPIWGEIPHLVVAIHTAGRDMDHPEYNRGVVLDDELTNWLEGRS